MNDPFAGPRYFVPGNPVPYWFHERGRWQLSRYSGQTIAECDSAAIRYLSLRNGLPSTVFREADTGRFGDQVELWRRIDWPDGCNQRTARFLAVTTYYGPGE